jgi:serine protease Do
MGVSFAIPVDVALEVVDQLKAGGHVSRGWLGVMIQEVNRDLAESFGLDKPSGALVARVLENSPAAKAGLKEGDVILDFNGKPIDLSTDLPHLVGRVRAGTHATLTIMREGKRKNVDVVVGELADTEDQVRAGYQPEETPQEPSRVGLAVEALPDASAERAGVEHGVRVLRADGPAAEAGIRVGDVITRLNNEEIDTVEKFHSVVDGLAPGRSVPVLIVRGSAPTFLALRVPED